MTHAFRKRARALVALLGITALIVALVATATKASAESPSSQSSSPFFVEDPTITQTQESLRALNWRESADNANTLAEKDALWRSLMPFLAGKAWNPDKWQDIHARYGGQATHQIWICAFGTIEEGSALLWLDPKNLTQCEWESRDRTAGFQPSEFSWLHNYRVTAWARVAYQNHNLCFEGVSVGHKHTLLDSSVVSDFNNSRAYGVLTGRTEEFIWNLINRIAEYCGPAEVLSWNGIGTASHLDPTQVYYGDTIAVHPQTQKLGSFLDWLWESTDSYAQMVGYLEQVVAKRNASGVAQNLADERAYTLAFNLLRR